MDELIKKEGVKHYVCDGGCKGVSIDDDTSCQAVDCPKHGQPLQSCTCNNSRHEEILSKDLQKET